ncbi:MAG: hypothetical protein Q9160_004261 [Pyrenula sp. 1 TL-2023]
MSDGDLFHDQEGFNIYMDEEAQSTAPITPQYLNPDSQNQHQPSDDGYGNQMPENDFVRPERRHPLPQRESLNATSTYYPHKYKQGAPKNGRTPDRRGLKKPYSASSMPPAASLPPPASILRSQPLQSAPTSKRGRKRKAPSEFDDNLPSTPQSSQVKPSKGRPLKPTSSAQKAASKRPKLSIDSKGVAHVNSSKHQVLPPPPKRSRPALTEEKTKRMFDDVSRQQLVHLIHQQAYYISYLQSQTAEDARGSLVEEATSFLEEKGGKEWAKILIDRAMTGEAY